MTKLSTTAPRIGLDSALLAYFLESGAGLADKGYFTEALAFLYKARAMAPEHEPTRQRLVQTCRRAAARLIREQRPLPAENLLRQALALDPTDPESVQMLATLAPEASAAAAAQMIEESIPLIFDGRAEQAERRLRQALSLDPVQQRGREALAIALYQQAVNDYNDMNFAAVEVALWQALQLRPDFLEARTLLEMTARHPARHVINRSDPGHTPAARALQDALTVRQASGVGLVRKGRDSDGGYVMADHRLQQAIVYALGVGHDVSWDLDMAALGCQLYQFDHTVPGVPDHPQFHWQKLGIAAAPGSDPQFRTLDQVIAGNGHHSQRDMILKCDIEGAEWPVLAALSDDTLGRFSQIVAEFHDLTRIIDPDFRQMVMTALDNLNRQFQLVHVHANNHGTLSLLGGIAVYDHIEVTYLRRSDHQFVRAPQALPLPLDRPCSINLADYVVSQFTC